MTIKIKFIGDDLSFYDEVKVKYEKVHDGGSFDFSYCSIKGEPKVLDVFKSLYLEKIDIIFLDFEKDKNFAVKLSKLINSNAELRKKSFCALHGYKDRSESIDLALLEQIRINHIKGIEIHDIIYDTMSFVDVDKAKSMPFASGEKIEDIEMYYKVWITQLKDSHLHVETNVKLNENTIIELDHHPLDHLAKSTRFLVTNYSDENLFYNTRFNYDLQFTYINDSFFKSSEQYWLDYLSYGENKDSYEKETGEDFEQMKRLVKTREIKSKHLKSELKEWLETNKNENIKKIKVMVFDDELNLIEELEKIDDYIVRYETGLIYDYYHVRRFNPHIILFNITDKHPVHQIQDVLDVLKKSNIKPVVIATNTDHQFDYEKYVCYPNLIELETLNSMIKTYREKVSISNNKQRVFFTSDHKRVKAESFITIEVIKMSESEIYFKCNYEIPSWSAFKVYKPFEMLFTVVPHLENSDYKKEPNVYRALINGTSEITKSELRVLINQSLEEVEDSEEGS